jgi:hydrophobic/amphiphilic exporter-1 (mainly G- bacteria), HAE1 family
MFLGLTSDVVPMSVLDDYAETMIVPRISMVSGVSQVQVQGAQKYAVRVQADPDKLHAQGIGLDEVSWPTCLTRQRSFLSGPTLSRSPA